MRKQLFLTLLILSSICWNIAAQQRGGDLEIKNASGEVVGTFAEAHALIIGESVYINGWRRLPGVKEDVAAVSRLFKEQKFNVEIMEDKNSRDLKSGITNFLDKYAYKPDARIVVYFAGHGATVDLGGRRMGYIVPVDAPPASNSSNFLQTAIPMTQFETWAKQYTSRHILFIFDSCFAGTVFRSQGSAPPAINRLINLDVRQFITSGDANEEVPDESIFRKELEHALRNAAADTNKDGYVSGTELGLYLYERVSNYMNGKQNPRIGKLNDTNLDKGDFIFAVSSGGASGVVTTSPSTRPEPRPATTPAAPPQQPVPNNMVRVEGGTFQMGSNDLYMGKGLYPARPVHTVKITGFYMAKYEVTQKEWTAIMGYNPSEFKGDNLPVERVSWYEAIEYCNRLSEKEKLTPAYTIDKSQKDWSNRKDEIRGHPEGDPKWMVLWNRNANGYRLPTEAEWEYAARGGNGSPGNYTYSGSNNIDEVAWYAGNSAGSTQEVGAKKPNGLGVYDMSGNVWEWCWDWYGSYPREAQTDPFGADGGSYRVLRGGGCYDTDNQGTSSVYRNIGVERFYRDHTLGFRLVRPIQ
jgi:formylglycine-generating enzyme required for sulfatase activity